MRAGVLVLPLVLAAAAPARGDEPDAPTVLPPLARQGGEVVSKPRVKLGEPFQVVLTVRARPEQAADLPATLAVEPFEVTGRRERQAVEDGLVRRDFELDVVAWELGALQLPPVSITYVAGGEVREVKSLPLDVDVEAVLPPPAEGAEPPAPADLAAPEKVMEQNRMLYWGAGAALAVAAVALLTWLLARRSRGRVAGGPVAVLDTRPPHEIALERLRALAAGLDAPDLRPFTFSLTEIVRDYLGRRFGFDALELTSTELCAELDRHGGAGGARDATRQELVAWLAECDLIKYAGVQATRAQAAQALERAVALVELTRPPPPAPAQPEVAHA